MLQDSLKIFFCWLQTFLGCIFSVKLLSYSQLKISVFWIRNESFATKTQWDQRSAHVHLSWPSILDACRDFVRLLSAQEAQLHCMSKINNKAIEIILTGKYLLIEDID